MAYTEIRTTHDVSYDEKMAAANHLDKINFPIKKEMREAEKNIPEIESLKEIDKVLTQELIDFYEEKTGLSLLDRTMRQPSIFQPLTEKQVRYGEFEGGYVNPSLDFVEINTIVGNTPKAELYKWFTETIPIHERFHAIGRSVRTVSHYNENAVQFKGAQVGFKINAGNGHLRGDLMEESGAHFYSENLLRDSTNPTIVEYRQKKLKAAIPAIISGKYLTEYEVKERAGIDASKDLTKEIDNLSNIQLNNIEDGLKPKSKRERACYDFYDALLNRAKTLGVEDDFEQLYLTARVDTEKTRQFFDLLEKMTGDREIARQMFKSTSTSFKEIRGFIKHLENQPIPSFEAPGL